MWRVARQNSLSGDAGGATDVDPAGGFADADLRAAAAMPQSAVNGTAQFNGTFPASFERGVSASVAASFWQTSVTSLGTAATSLSAAATLPGAAAAIPPGTTAASSPIGPDGATPAQVRQAVNGATLPTTGAGIKVGVMSTSFNNLGGAATDERDGALPPAANVQVLKDLASGGDDEGRAMMQIVHDIAPAADLAFYTADISEQEFADGIIALANAGCNVICDDFTYEDEPFFQTGVVANAIQQVEQRGVIFVTCAGNQGVGAYQTAWSNIASTTYGGRTLTNTLNFGTDANPNPVQTITVRNDIFPSPMPLILEWNQPYGNITSSLALVVFRDGTYVGTYDNTNDDQPEAGNPFVLKNLDAGHTYQIAIEVESGPPPSLIKDELFNDGDMSSVILNGANAGTVYGHHFSTDAITVGAVNSANTPGNDGSLASESFSSSGAGTQLWFNHDGKLVPNAPQLLSPVAISGVDNIDTTVFHPFFGTSAATPSVAAVIANMLQINPALTFAQIKQILQQTASPFGDPLVAGAGLVDALAAVTAAMPPPPNAPPAGTTADMVLSNPGGVYNIYNIGGNSILAGYQLAFVGTDWAFVTLGGFNDGETADMLLRNGSTGAFEVYDIVNNNITQAVSMGAVGLNWQVAGFGDFNQDGATDMMLRDSGNGAFQIYNISNNSIINSVALGTVGLDWQVGGFGNFSSLGESDMILRNTTTGGLLVYDIRNNQVSNAFSLGAVGWDWQIAGFGNFSSVPGETDMLMRNTTTGAFQLYDISNNQITSAFSLGAVGLNWQVAGFGPLNGAGTSDMVLVSNGTYLAYDIADNQVTGTATLGQVGPNWQVGGFAAAAPTGSAALMDSSAQLVQAMASFAAPDAIDSSSAAPFDSGTSQQVNLLTPADA
jgi:hypothetical protein